MLFSLSVYLCLKDCRNPGKIARVPMCFFECPHHLISDKFLEDIYIVCQTDRIETSSIPSVNIYAVCFPNLHGMFCHLL